MHGSPLRTSMLGGVLLLLTACAGGDGGRVEEAMRIPDLKIASWRQMIGERVVLEGYLLINQDGTGLLLDDLADEGFNQPIPEGRYLALGPEFLRGLDPADHYKACVRVEGVVRATADRDRTFLRQVLGDLSQCELQLLAPPIVLLPWPGDKPKIMDICGLLPGFCSTLGTSPTKYALLYSGGINKDGAKLRYWNDIVLYYVILVGIYDYDPANVIVVYKDGVGESPQVPVDHPATSAGLDAAFVDLALAMDTNDEFFLFMTNHGSTTNDGGSPLVGDEPGVVDATDEIVYYYNTSGFPYDDDIAASVNFLPFARMCAVLEPCYGGGLIWDLRGPNRVICTACTEFQLSCGGTNYDPFVFHFGNALLGLDAETALPVDADEDDDGKVSIYEAFRYAVANDPCAETPQYEDSGDGLPTALPELGVTADGAFGSTYFLD